jgi:hypothetical protein
VLVRFTVSGDGGTLTGDVSVTASGGSESCTASDAAGSCALTLTRTGEWDIATYSGDNRFTGSSDRARHQVQAPPTAEPDHFVFRVRPRDVRVNEEFTVVSSPLSGLTGPRCSATRSTCADR